jgi:predicted GH43/DUF377 family glycosyl hydrolase
MKKNLYLTFLVPMIFLGIYNCGTQDSEHGDIANCRVESNRILVADKSNFKENIGGTFIVHNWEKKPGPVFEKKFDWEGIGPNFVRVFQKQEGYVLFYGTYSLDGVNKNNYPQGIAWSENGLKWKRHPTSLDKDGFNYQSMERVYFPNNPTGYDYLGIAIYRATEKLPFRVDFFKSENGIDWDKFNKAKKTWWYGPSDVIDFFYDYSRKKFYMYHKIWKVEGTKINGEKYDAYFPAFRPEIDKEKNSVRIKGWKELFTNKTDVDVILKCTGHGHEDGGGGTVTKDMRMMRVIALAESDDFLHWSNHHVILEPEFENRTAQYYSTPVLPYQCLHLCFPRYLQGDTGEMHIYFGISDLNKIESLSKQPVIKCGNNGNWDSGLISSSTPVEINNKLCMYYSARRTSHTASYKSKIVSAFGRAWLRKDGFVSYTGGTLITKPINMSGKELKLNAKGKIVAKLYDIDGKEIFSGIFTGDEISRTIIKIDSIINEQCYIKFDCSNGELFSFWFK